ncbi:DMT family transporter [Megamonas funiformis]|uniref:DMT family transporter n=1 Tax=Megamonas funiformis TaxID=437897 RepID=UPI00266F207B|nr:EamA family transporter [Megamonas funiformis]
MKLKQWIQIFPILSGIMWGSAGIFVRKLSELGLNSVSIVETRIIVAIIIIIAGLLCLDKKLLKIKLKDLWIFICAGIFSMLGLNLCYNFAINELTLSLSAVLLSLAPIFVLILASILFKEKLTLQKTVCAILALIGCILSSGVLEEVGAMKWTTIGIIIGTLGAFFYGTYSIFSKITMLKGYHSFTVTIYSLMAVGIALLPFTDWLKVWEIIQIAPAPMSGFLLLHSLLTSVLPYICFTVALNYVEAGKVAILASGEPIAAMLFGIFFYQEIPTILSLIGLFTVLLALGLLTIPFTKLKKIFN